MDFKLSKEHQMLQKAVREFAAKKIAPNADEWDANHYYPYKEAIKPMGELGFFGTVIPEEYEGDDMGWLAAMIVTEEIARASSSLRVQIKMQTRVVPIRFTAMALKNFAANTSLNWSAPRTSAASALRSRMPDPMSWP